MAMKAASTVEAHAAMEATAMEPPTLAASAMEATASEAARSTHHSGSGMEAATCRSWATVNAVGVIAASYVVIAGAPVTNVGAEMVIVRSSAASVR